MIRKSSIYMRSLLSGLLMAACLLTIAACDRVVDPEDEYEPVSGLDELRELDGMWQGLDREGDEHSSSRRFIHLAIDDSVFHEAYHNPSDCFLISENKILEAGDEEFVIRLEDGQIRDVRFELDANADQVKFVNHLDREYHFGPSNASLSDFTPECENDSENVSAEPLLIPDTD